MKNIYFLLLFSIVFVGCKDDINDQSKRNADNCWWVDAKTGKGKWIPIRNQTTVKNGKYTVFYYDGKVFEKGKLIDGKNVDTIFYYDRNGRVQEYGLVKNDTTIHYILKDGLTKYYYQKGNILSEGIVKNHTGGDQWKYYYKNGNLKWVRDFHNGVGWRTSYYEDGAVSDSAYNGSNGLNEIKQWYPNGKLKSQIDGDFKSYTGTQKFYFDDGQLKSICAYTNGQANGSCTTYYPDGKIESTQTYKNDLRDGHQTLYFENGKIKIDSYMANGKPNGDVKVYNEDGKLIRINTFKDGERIASKSFDEMSKYLNN